MRHNLAPMATLVASGAAATTRLLQLQCAGACSPRIQTYKYINTYIHVCAYIHVQGTQIYSFMHATCLHTYIQTHKHAHTQIVDFISDPRPRNELSAWRIQISCDSKQQGTATRANKNTHTHEMQREAQRHTETHRDTQRHTETHRDTHRVTR